MPAEYTYDPTTLADEAVARVRLLIGDTDVSGDGDTAEFADQEIEFELETQDDDERLTAIALLEKMATRYARRVTVASGSQRINLSDAYDRVRAEAQRLRDAGPEGDAALMTTAPLRVDGYSDDIEADDVSPRGTEPGCGWDDAW